MSTCKWCGKQFNYSPFSRGSRSTEYCCGRCYNAAKREEQRAREESRKRAEESSQTLKQIGGGSESRGCLIVAAIVVVFILIIGSSKQGNEEKAEEVQKTVTTQPIVEVESNEQIMQVANQTELVEISKETSDNMLPEPLEMPERWIERVEGEEIIELGKTELEEEVRPDFSRQKVYDIVDVMPAYPDGEHELMEYIADNIEYPKEAIERGIEGRVFVKFIVEPDGSISNVKIIRGIGYGCDEEAIRVIESMPAWKPGRKNGEVVRVSMAAPVSFKLQ